MKRTDLHRRTGLGRLLAWIAVRRLRAEYGSIHVEGEENLLTACRHNRRVTIFSSHTSNLDIAAIDYHVRTALGNDRAPVFILRDDLALRVRGSWCLPLSVSQHIYSEHFKNIALNQRGMGGMLRIMPLIDTAYRCGHSVVICPGGTRFMGPVNGLTAVSVAMYTALLKRKGMVNGHAFLPVGITYRQELGTMRIAYGRPISLGGTVDHRKMGGKVFSEIAELSGVPADKILSAEQVRSFIMSRSS